MWLKKCLSLFLLVLFVGFLYAQDLDTISSIDQALIELNNLEQNQMLLKNLIIERENTILEKDKLLNQMTLQYKNLEISYSLLKSGNKISRILIYVLSGIVLVETSYILIRK
jgi:hypothetical protein